MRPSRSLLTLPAAGKVLGWHSYSAVRWRWSLAIHTKSAAFLPAKDRCWEWRKETTRAPGKPLAGPPTVGTGRADSAGHQRASGYPDTRRWKRGNRATAEPPIGRVQPSLDRGISDWAGVQAGTINSLSRRPPGRSAAGSVGGGLRSAGNRRIALAVGRYQFTHALVQETLAEALSATRRGRLQARIGEAPEELYGAAAHFE